MNRVARLVRDARLLATYARTAAAIRDVRPDGDMCIVDRITPHAEKQPDRPALVADDRSVTWGEMEAAANRVAHWALEQGIGCGDVVALSMENRPEFVITWLGLARIGAVTALLNTNLEGERLAHCVREADCTHWIVGSELEDACATALPLLERPPTIWKARDPAATQAGESPLADAQDLDAALTGASSDPVGREARAGLKTGDPVFYIYTSGTTGLPKAARVSHFRFTLTAAGGQHAQELTPQDRVYIALPLYHSAGGMMAAGGGLFAGATLILTRKFSASRFWSDCTKHGATTFQYIGELCRYLLNAPPHPDERRHRLRVCMGNGLRPEVWGPFQERFAIPRIIEFYGATEGNVALMNLDGAVGAIGRLPRLLQMAMGLEIVRYDVDADEIVRGPDGRCIRCKPGEPGEALGRITKLARFEGYTNQTDTEKKLLRDAFRDGDAYFRTGDLLRYDEDGNFYFVDRIGDTFRWKGENVATSEVAEVLAVVPGILEVNVYGVEVPGAEGRAGMAAIVVDDAFDVQEFGRRVDAELAAYARPVFLRILPEMETTATFKHRKVDLVREGFDPDRVPDPVYFRDSEKGGYVPLDRALQERIESGAVRV